MKCAVHPLLHTQKVYLVSNDLKISIIKILNIYNLHIIKYYQINLQVKWFICKLFFLGIRFIRLDVLAGIRYTPPQTRQVFILTFHSKIVKIIL